MKALQGWLRKFPWRVVQTANLDKASAMLQGAAVRLEAAHGQANQLGLVLVATILREERTQMTLGKGEIDRATGYRMEWERDKATGSVTVRITKGPAQAGGKP